MFQEHISPDNTSRDRSPLFSLCQQATYIDDQDNENNCDRMRLTHQSPDLSPWSDHDESNWIERYRATYSLRKSFGCVCNSDSQLAKGLIAIERGALVVINRSIWNLLSHFNYFAAIHLLFIRQTMDIGRLPMIFCRTWEWELDPSQKWRCLFVSLFHRSDAIRFQKIATSLPFIRSKCKSGRGRPCFMQNWDSKKSEPIVSSSSKTRK